MEIEEKKAIDRLNKYINLEAFGESFGERNLETDIRTLLSLVAKKGKQIEELKEYAKWHIEHINEDVKDYIDDDKEVNKNLIGELKEEREHWRDIIRIINKKKTYIDYKN